jgi:hypothetical protein
MARRGERPRRPGDDLGDQPDLGSVLNGHVVDERRRRRHSDVLGNTAWCSRAQQQPHAELGGGDALLAVDGLT